MAVRYVLTRNVGSWSVVVCRDRSINQCRGPEKPGTPPDGPQIHLSRCRPPPTREPTTVRGTHQDNSWHPVNQYINVSESPPASTVNSILLCYEISSCLGVKPVTFTAPSHIQFHPPYRQPRSSRAYLQEAEWSDRSITPNLHHCHCTSVYSTSFRRSPA